MTVHPAQVLELIWIAWLMSWIAASFWLVRPQRRATTLETWTYRAAMIAGATDDLLSGRSALAAVRGPARR